MEKLIAILFPIKREKYKTHVSHEFYIHESVFKLRVKVISLLFEKLHYWQIPEECPIV